MLRHKTMLLIRKYLILLFAIILTFIWLNHRKITNNEDDELVHLPSVAITTTTEISALQRQQRLRKLVQKYRSFLTNKDWDQKETAITRQEKTRKFNFGIQPKVTFSPDITKSRYFVNSEKCKIPYTDPFSREALEIYTPFKLKLCSNESDIFELTYDVNSKHYMLHINEKTLRRVSPRSRVVCNFRTVSQGGNIYSERIYFTHSQKLPRNISGIITECHDAMDKSKIVQQDAFPLVQFQMQMQNKTSTESNPKRRQPSVILLGIDSMSRMNFRRTMPRTAEFVSQRGWFEMEGYNKVADNTLRNLLPILLGQTVEQYPRKCGQNEVECIEKFPWIWKDYKRAGYTIALAEDMADSGVLFTNNKNGYFPGLVDHSLHALLLRMEQAMKTYVRFGYNYCIGRRLTISYVYDFCQQIISRYMEESHQPTFGYFWSSTFTHDYNFGAASLDAKFDQYLQQFKAHNLFEHAIVILYSDHGARFGELLNLSDSFLEERLPMLHIYLPPWFRHKYPKYSQALYLNRNRLSSNFDLHNTLRHILQLNATLPTDLAPLVRCPSSQSLLHTLPRERSCEDACITEHWCTCKEFIAQSMNGEMFYISKMVVYHINRWMLVHRYNEFCQRIQLSDMESAEKKMLFEENSTETMHGDIAIYRLRFRTFPGSATFQATVRLNRELKKLDNFYVPDISRLNAYHNDSLCINDVIGKKFCVCYPNTTLDPFMSNWKELKLTTLPS
ncbi:uncharacterized protein LOC132791003 isoform X1 [Drosophila nasuta]|uniref:uncharacterized protein LOC132791003 isoform X1 n=2 Tax=Drosophila nasuta TaxID=42062 RepID=UPI00295EDF3C|nr:uncharacterized protein LOC132791003 isoform X1 [Drosophila nasuta]